MPEQAWPRANPDYIGLWRYNTITGYWVMERSCAPDTANEWLHIFQCQSEGSIHLYKLAKKRPTKAPKGY